MIRKEINKGKKKDGINLREFFECLQSNPSSISKSQFAIFAEAVQAENLAKELKDYKLDVHVITRNLATLNKLCKSSPHAAKFIVSLLDKNERHFYKVIP